MDIKLEQYKVFFAVVNSKSFSLAAQKLFMSQSAVSQSIKQLESSLECTLFTRTAKGVTLTAEGTLLTEYISPALELISSGESRITALKKLEFGELKIGASDTISRYLLLPYLAYFSKSYPSIKIKIINRTSFDTIDMLNKGLLDIAFVNFPIEQENLRILKSFKVQDIFVAGERFKHLRNQPISLKKLVNLPLIFLEGKSNSRRYVDKYLTQLGINYNAEIELGSHDLLLEFANINLGIACVIDIFSKNYLQDKLFKITTEPMIPPRKICACSLKRVPISPATKKFIEILTGNVINN